MLLGLFCLGGAPTTGVAAQGEMPDETPDEMLGVPREIFPGRDFELFFEEQAIGFYSDGSLFNPDGFAAEGEGWVKIARPRDRGWGARDLIELISQAAAGMSRAFAGGERLQLGDASAHGGGRLPEHASHQNGLDIDLVYYRMDHQEQSPEIVTGFQEDFVEPGSGRISANFDLQRNHALMKSVATSGRLNRIFLDAAIKKALCGLSLSRGELARDAEFLRRLRPWPNHSRHMHVRITCPRGAQRCVPQEEPPPGHGCEQL